jgi:class III poly(R)-hydroxyalkanoic acid synthase PhaE subunit
VVFCRTENNGRWYYAVGLSKSREPKTHQVETKSMNEQWAEAQQKYWNAWMDLARRGMESATPATPRAPANPWAGALDHWWKAMAPEAPRPAQDVFSQMLEMGKGYFGMAENLQKTGLGQDPARLIEDWSRVLSDSFGQWTSGTNPFAAFTGAGGKEKMAFWDLPFDNLTRTLSVASPLPGDFLKAFETRHPMDMQTQMNRFLSAPAIGYGREAQEQYQRFARLMMDYERAMADYNAGFVQVNNRSLEAFRAKVMTRDEKDGPITSVRELFNLWVDACEDVYAEYAMTDEYAQRYGKMVNALMAVKQQGATLVDEWLESMNMPTRKDLGDIQKRLHDTRCAASKLRAETQMMRAEMDGLASIGEELVQLREEVKALRAQLTGQKPVAPAVEAETALDAIEATGSSAAASEPARTTRTRKSPTTTKASTTTRRKTQ